MPIYQNGKEVTPKLNGKNLSRVMYNGKKIWPIGQSIIPPSESQACDICFYDKINDKLIIVKDSMWNIESFPSSKYTPIGVVVVPGTHNVYGDGSCGIMSLKPMNCDTPLAGGTSEQGMYWGSANILELPNLDQVPIGNTSNGIPTGSNFSGYLPSDKFSNTQCVHDTDAYYSSLPYISSPYLTDGSRNPGYYQTSSPSSSNNALADFDGKGNTKKIIAQRGVRDYNSWTPGKTTSTDYPAASCCDMFHTEGTSQGDWYLPACGELGYIMPPFNKINNAIYKICTAYDLSAGIELTSYTYWSSTENNSSDIRTIATGIGGISHSGKNYSFYVRAFLRVG